MIEHCWTEQCLLFMDVEACDRLIRANTLWQVIKFVFLSCANRSGLLVYLNKLVLLLSLLKFSALHQKLGVFLFFLPVLHLGIELQTVQTA